MDDNLNLYVLVSLALRLITVLIKFFGCGWGCFFTKCIT